MNCVDCGDYFAKDYQTRQCKDCFNSYVDYLKTKLRDIETNDEPRADFLLRRSKDFGLNHTKDQINEMIANGMSDFSILETKVYYTKTERRAGEIKWLLKNTNLLQREIAVRYETTQGTVSSIKAGRIYEGVKELRPSSLINDDGEMVC